jgi:hypothetical protein
MQKTITKERTYMYSVAPLLLRDAPKQTPVLSKYQIGNTERPLVLEQYLNDLYHHFLYKLTSAMQAPQLNNETKLRSLLNELIRTKKMLQEGL